VLPLLLLFLIPAATRAAEVHISFNALERTLSSQIFTDEGRRYVKGSRDDKCNYAWLEKPQIRGMDGRLKIQARFTGRSSIDIFGRCIGMGDSFPLTITSTPFYESGYVGLKDVKVTPDPGYNRFYASSVCAALGGSLQRTFRYPLANEAKQRLDAPDRQLRKFNVTAIRVTPEALILEVDFTIFIP
jgi:hypothetical protein